ncbi:MAG: cytochrome c maturation protein CcmE [Tepidamorphaceae bacterium]|nr:cytochrome c maturation protein CcmE [Rhodobiaceae bacterium]MCC0048538.1 cytochrome c maturation protein CcmE [Rhodobiaceae bacterium]
MTRKQRRLTLIAAAGSVLAIAVGLVLYAFQDTIVFFTTPTEVQAKPINAGVRMRLGGLVADESVVRGQGTAVSFSITDTTATVPVVYDGTLPDLFREGQGVVAEGMFDSEGVFIADTVLAKHDENYMPKEVADALKKQGVWNPSE